MALETDPIDLLLDDDNDLVIEDGDFVWSRGIEAVVQEARIAMQMFQEEWFLDLDVGIPYWQRILGQKPEAAAAVARLVFRAALEDIEDISEILQLDVQFTRDTRTMRIIWRARTTFGDTPLDVLTLEIGGAA